MRPLQVEELRALPIRKLKAILAARGGSDAPVVEKEDLVQVPALVLLSL